MEEQRELTEKELTYEDFKFALSNLFDNDSYNKYVCNFKKLEIKTVKKAFREKAKEFHPDKAVILGEDEKKLETKFKDINNSYQILISLLSDKNGLNKLSYGSFDNRTRKKTVKKDNIKKNYNTDKGSFWKGSIPNRILRFSEFLYYSKVINRAILIESLTWQFKNRPRIGEIALECNLLTNNDILKILRNLKFSEKFGEAAIRLGILNQKDVNLCLHKQKNYNCPIGTFFVENNILPKYMIDHYIERQKKHNQKYV